MAQSSMPADFNSVLAQVTAASDFLAQQHRLHPDWIAELDRQGLLNRAYRPGELDDRLGRHLDDIEMGDDAELARRLRQFRNIEMLRIIWRDLTRSAPLAETLEDLSALADACIGRVTEILTGWLEAKYGVPRDADGARQGLLILGMGKLGARELNLSSDIDLIFCYPERGHTDGARQLDNEAFFTRLGRQLIKALGEVTADGFAFRVDMRLRPFGDAGPLAINFDAMETYYLAQAREWERYAMIKARVVNGDPTHAERLMAILRPFVYRRYIDFGVVESLRKLKAMIVGELHKKGMDANIKLGRGGIREIEFIGQAFQLMRGGRDPELQIRPILPILAKLADKRLLPDRAVAELTKAYEFLRLTENRLQAWRDEQTHVLPDEEAGRQRLANSMGHPDWPSFSSELEAHRDRVQTHFEAVFADRQPERTEEADHLSNVWSGQIPNEQAQAALGAAGYQQAARALAGLDEFRGSAACRSLSTRGHDRLDRLMPMLLGAAGRCDQPDLALRRLLVLLQAIVRRTAYLDLLVENPTGLEQLVKLTAHSLWVADLLTHHPILLDELLDPRSLYAPLRRTELTQELDALLGQIAADDLEAQMERLRQFAKSNRLRVAAADLTDVIPLMKVSDFLTEIAEVVLARVLTQTWATLAGRHGNPTQVLGESGFAIIGYGKLGGWELGYGSDLDLVFLHGSQSMNAMTDGDKPIANDVFFARLGQRLINRLSTKTASGELFEVDMRLRPNGNSGLLVSSLTAFEKYQTEQAWTWEHQALLRARPVAGDPVVAKAFGEIRRRILTAPRDIAKLREDVLGMREKMRANLDKTDADLFDLKQGRGGIVDIEFMVQFLVLRWAGKYPDLIDWTDNIRLLEGLARQQLLAEDAAERLREAYKTYRDLLHHQALQEQPGLVADNELIQQRARVREVWSQVMGQVRG